MNTKILFVLIAFAACLAGPLYSRVVVDGVLTHDYELEIGTKTYGSLTLSNRSDKSAGVKIFLNDFRNSGLSAFSGPAGSAPRSNADWITFDCPEFITLQPNETRKILYSIEVPRNNTLSGTYWCVVMVEPVVESAPVVVSGGFSITPIIRYAIQIITTIRGTGESIIEIGERKVVFTEKDILIKIEVKNKGGKVFKAPVAFQMFSSAGKKIIDEKSQDRRVFPDESMELVYTVPQGTPPGEYQMLLFLEGEDDTLVAQYDLTIP